MKRLNIFLMLVFMVCSCWINSVFAQGNEVDFPDDNLAAAVRSALRIGATDPILENALQGLTDLSASGEEISDLRGLDKATGLTTLDLGQNAIASVDPLGFLENLETLDLADNQIQQIQAISNLPALETLDLRNNSLMSLNYLEDALELELETLYLNGNADLIDDLTDPDQLDNARLLVKLKTVGQITIDLTLPSPVTFRDDNLAAALRSSLGLGEGDPIFPADMQRQTFTTFSAPSQNISNITGLETAINLTSLELNGNEIASLTPLAKLEALETLNLADNKNISSISSLSGLSVLTELVLFGNRISSVSPLTGLTGLTILELANNTISSLTALAELINLTYLDLSNNRITDVLPLQGLSTLLTLHLSGNENLTLEKVSVLYTLLQVNPSIEITLPDGIELPNTENIVTFEDLNLAAAVRSTLRITRGYPILKSKITELTRLTATGKEIDDLTGLEAATGLISLTLGNNKIEDLVPLQPLTELTTLDLGQNNIEDLVPLQPLKKLTTLDLADNQIQDVSSLSVLSALKTLDLRNNSLTEVIHLPDLQELKTLYLRGNAGLIDDLDDPDQLDNARALVKLKTVARTTIDLTLPRPVTFQDDNLATVLRNVNALNLHFDDPIFPVDMQRQTFTTFSAPRRSISNITGLETATNLTSLELNGNEIASLTPLAKLVNLETLNLADNKNISSISSLSKLIHLTDLNLSANKISSLTSLSGLTALTTLNLSNNVRIKDVLPLQGLRSLRTLNLSGNTDITNGEVLYKLRQGGTAITLPTGITLPTDAVVFTNTDLEAAVRSALRISKGHPILTTGEKRIETLTRLTATRKEIDNLTGLEGATALTRLDLGDNAIVDLGPLSGLTSLTHLDLADNQIIALTRLSGLSLLENLDLDDNQITDVSALSGLTSLKTLDLRGNDVGDVTPLKDLTSLTQIYLKGNENITNLEWLGALENLRADIQLPDVVGLPDTNLDREVRDALSVTGTLPMSEELLESLTTLTASSRSITDLTGCEYMTALTSLDLRNNQITDVSPLSKLYSLETLMLDENPILDTSVLRELERRGTEIDITIYRYPSWDVNQDGDVDEADVFLITATITDTQNPPDVNGDGIAGDAADTEAADANKDDTVNTADLLLVFEKFDRPVNLAAPLLSAESAGLDWALLEGINADRLRVQLDILRAENDGSLKYQQAITFLQAVLVALHPNQTLLLANYPNPFNPETWLPYQLARGSNVWITIYDTPGAVVRRLALGYRAEGYYRARGRAAHWEGRNEVGERVASGIYFYQLETDDTSLLRKMVILK